MTYKLIFLLSALVDVGDVVPLRVGLALLLLLSTLVDIGDVVPLRIRLTLLFFGTLVNVRNVIPLRVGLAFLLLLRTFVNVGNVVPLRVGLALPLLSALVNISNVVPLRVGLALLLLLSALVDVSDVCGSDKYLKFRGPETPGGKLTVPLGLSFTLLVDILALYLVDVGDVVPLGISIAVLDFFGLNRGGTGKAGSEANNGRYSGDTHIEHWEMGSARRSSG
jgi:hypothetical protein